MKLTFLGHACFLIDTGKEKILTDPFLTGNALASVSADEVQADYICVTHGHGDHLGDAVAIAKRTGAKIITTVDMGEAVFAPEGLELILGNIGGNVTTPFGSVKIVNAIHGSGIPGCLSCGFVFRLGEKTIYFAGDTALTADMAFLKKENIDIALLPIGDVFTMGPADALEAVKLIEPKMVVPMHYNTFPFIVQDADAFAESVRKEGRECTALKPGETLEF